MFKHSEICIHYFETRDAIVSTYTTEQV